MQPWRTSSLSGCRCRQGSVAGSFARKISSGELVGYGSGDRICKRSISCRSTSAEVSLHLDLGPLKVEIDSCLWTSPLQHRGFSRCRTPSTSPHIDPMASSCVWNRAPFTRALTDLTSTASSASSPAPCNPSAAPSSPSSRRTAPPTSSRARTPPSPSLPSSP